MTRCRTADPRPPLRGRPVLLTLAVALVLAIGLAGCGRKAAKLSLPEGADEDRYPLTYPAPRYAHPDPDYVEPWNTPEAKAERARLQAEQARRQAEAARRRATADESDAVPETVQPPAADTAAASAARAADRAATTP